MPPLQRIPDQDHESIVDTFSSIATDGSGGWEDAGAQMLALIQQLETHTFEPAIWAGTSLCTLILSNHPRQPTHAVLVSSQLNNQYHVVYETSLQPQPEGGTALLDDERMSVIIIDGVDATVSLILKTVATWDRAQNG
jgi:hypothetical protein